MHMPEDNSRDSSGWHTWLLKFSFKVPAWLRSGEGSLPGMRTATFSLHLYKVFLWWVWTDSNNKDRNVTDINGGERWIDGWKDGRKDWKNKRKEGEKEKKGSSVSSYKTTNPVSSFPCLWLHWTIINFPRGPISKYKHTRDKASNIHIWGGYIQSTTVLLIQSLPLPPTVSL